MTSKTAHRLLTQLAKHGAHGTTAATLADQLGFTPRTTRETLNLMLDHGLVQLGSRNRYINMIEPADPANLKQALQQAIASTDNTEPTTNQKGQPTMTATPATPTSGTCGCCNAPIGKKSRFAPGHDARFVSNLVSDLVASIGTDEANHGTLATLVMTQTAELVRTAYSDALANKFAAAAERALTRPQRTQRTQRTTTTPETWQSADPIKVGRWTYPARQDETGRTQRNTKRDGSGTWVDIQGS